MQASEHDVLVVSAKGNAELRGGGTSLSALDLQALILVDGRSTLAQIAKSVPGMDAPQLSETIERLLEQRYVAPAKDPDADFIDPDSTLNLNIAAGVSPLTARGFRVAIARRAAAERTPPAGTTIGVLAIDEDANIAKFLRTYFDPAQFALKVAGDKTQIVEALRQPPLPEVVLADASMPGIDAVVAAIRRHEILRKIPMIMFAGNDTREAAIQALQSGVHGYMTKPLDMELLLVSVRSVLGLPQEAVATMGFGSAAWDSAPVSLSLSATENRSRSAKPKAGSEPQDQNRTHAATTRRDVD
jgi:DNA-binding response OmpR family regulator